LTAADPKGPVEPDWESVKAHYQYAEWFRDAKFGIFLHWGLKVTGLELKE
jgi:alpha-L-fucosidase